MIDVSDLTVRRGNQTVLERLSFRLEPGASLAILGANGVGKTTLLSALIGVLPRCGGRVDLAGRIGFVPQLFDVPFSYSVLDIALMGRARHLGLFGAPGRKDFEIVRQNLSLLEIEHLEACAFNTLSGGQRQLVMIAQALSSECDLLILDEPCSALDYRNQDKVLRLLDRLRVEHGQTVFFSTHMPQHAVEVATHVLLLESPARYHFGPIADVLTAPNLSDLYGLPVGRAVFSDGIRHTFAPLFRMETPHG